MTPDSIQEAFAGLEYELDERRPPDELERDQFRAGWEDATKPGEGHANGTPQRFTWRSLGYRLGLHFGDQSPEEIDAAFDHLAMLYEVERTPSWWDWAKQQLLARLRGISCMIIGIGFIALLAAIFPPPKDGAERRGLAKMLAIPLALLVLAGWLELLTGVPFWRLNATYTNARALRKTALTLLVLVAVGLFIASAIFLLTVLFPAQGNR
jgi:5-methylcytosine-specific restriction protein A